METCGLIAEYNPFHDGHLAQIEAIRRATGPRTAVVVALSGHVTQRGEPSLLPLRDRVRTALELGADLIFELPPAASLSSAEAFAAAGVRLLHATGVVRRLAYGTEYADHPENLRSLAAFLNQESDAFRARLRERIREGTGFAAARALAVRDTAPDPALADLLERGNTVLAVEYEKALLREGSPFPTLPLPLIQPSRYSASAVRDQLSVLPPGKAAVALGSVLPPVSAAAVAHRLFSGPAPAFLDAYAPFLYALPCFREEAVLDRVRGMGGGLAARVINALNRVAAPVNSDHLASFLADLATRAFPLSRVRRAFLSACYGLDEATDPMPRFLRLLGFSERGRHLLKIMKRTATLPVVTRRADLPPGDEAVHRQFRSHVDAGNLWTALHGGDAPDEGNRVVEQCKRRR